MQLFRCIRSEPLYNIRYAVDLAHTQIILIVKLIVRRDKGQIVAILDNLCLYCSLGEPISG